MNVPPIFVEKTQINPQLFTVILVIFFTSALQYGLQALVWRRVHKWLFRRYGGKLVPAPAQDLTASSVTPPAPNGELPPSSGSAGSFRPPGSK